MSFYRGSIAQCISGHPVLFLADAGEFLEQEPCDVCEKETPVKPEKKEIIEKAKKDVKGDPIHLKTRCERGDDIYLLADDNGRYQPVECETCISFNQKTVFPHYVKTRCHNFHEAYLILEEDGKYTRPECGECEHEKKLAKKTKMGKVIIPESKHIEMKNTFVSGPFTISQHEVTGPYGDGSYVVNKTGVFSARMIQDYGGIQNVPLHYLTDMRSLDCNESLCIAMYEANPEFWMSRRIDGPFVLLQEMIGIGFLPCAKKYNKKGWNQEGREDDYVQRMTERHGFNIIIEKVNCVTKYTNFVGDHISTLHIRLHQEKYTKYQL